jgi:YhcH/YjgK/YiaL family protein
LVSGAEKIGYANINSLAVTEDYHESGDYLLLKGNGDIITLPAGSFAIFYPEDAHMPCLQADGKQHVKKVVVKVRL